MSLFEKARLIADAFSFSLCRPTRSIFIEIEGTKIDIPKASIEHIIDVRLNGSIGHPGELTLKLEVKIDIEDLSDVFITAKES